MVGLDLPDNIRLLKIDYEAMMVQVRLFPDEGPFSGTQIDFEIFIPALYPHRPPKAKILAKVNERVLYMHICL